MGLVSAVPPLQAGECLAQHWRPASLKGATGVITPLVAYGTADTFRRQNGWMNDAQRIDHRVHDEVHDCIAPGCGKRAQTAFIGQESGRFAGRDMKPGDWVDLCADHAGDVYSAQGKAARDLPEWLRVDAKADPLDALLGDWGM